MVSFCKVERLKIQNHSSADKHSCLNRRKTAYRIGNVGLTISFRPDKKPHCTIC